MTDHRRRGTRAPRTSGSLHQQPYGQIPRPYAPIEVLSADNIAAIHSAALKVLAEIGMKVLEPRARAFFATAGAIVTDETVRIDPAMVMAHLSTVPAHFTLESRNPARSLLFGGNNCVFASVGGPAYVVDNDKGRRDAPLLRCAIISKSCKV